MRLVLIGESEDRLAAGLATRLRKAGAVVIEPPAPLEEDGLRATLREGADAAIETCVVDRERKSQAAQLLDRLLPSEVPLLACCHATSATAVAAGLRHPGRVVGFALLPPWEERTTVECAPAFQTSQRAVATAEAVWRAIGLEPVWVGDSVGLVLPRTVACLVNEAAFAVMDRTATAGDLDRAMELGTRYPRGPLAWAELIGLEQVLATLEALAVEHGPDCYRPAPLLRRLALAGRRSFRSLPPGGRSRPANGQ